MRLEPAYSLTNTGRGACGSRNDSSSMAPRHAYDAKCEPALVFYYGYRYYDAETGRWLNRDPIGERARVLQD